METVAAFIAEQKAVIGLFVLAGMFGAFVWERFSPSVVAVAGAGTMLALGLLDEKGAYGVFSNSAPLTVGAMFILSGALIRTGVIDKVGNYVVDRAKRHPRLAVVEVFGGGLLVSGFINSTPFVVVMMPVCFRLAEALGVSPKKLLMPLSVIAVLGGCLTLIGTSTNLVVSGIAEQAGLEPFGLFDITPYGLAVAAAGVVGLLLMARFLPSDYPRIAEKADGAEQLYLTELGLRDDDTAIDMALDAASLGIAPAQIVGVVANGRLITGGDAQHHRLAAGNRIVARLDGAALMTLRSEGRFAIGIGDSPERESTVVEVTVSPSHRSIDRPLAEIPFLQRQRVRILGVTRFRHLPGPTLSENRIRAADRLLIDADEANIAQLRDNPNLIGLAMASVTAFRRRRAWIAILVMASAVLLSATDVMSIGIAAFIGVAIVLLTRCIDASEAWGSIDGDVLILIFAMLAVGAALEQSGSVALMVGALDPILAGAPQWAVIAIVYFSALLLSELLSNNAVAALMGPLVIGIAEATGVAPQPLLIALMLGASACFATPVGYQTNTLVYAAGDYRFMDFVRIGVPLNILTGVAGCAALAFWTP
ncbi:putative sodium/sulfate symporter [Sphingopyxis sp. LC81]|uniref:SLC13 family permease n=1 Tax=Sphingopyxis sp. LC81 TaxID=1502850 RepID=UPI00050F687E|nr:SLC13 family permease [Sphingopyxis sp. LC81]KGB55815.1 putative sodium/sulfate symporter [Sphingopyxis sp. LC81]